MLDLVPELDAQVRARAGQLERVEPQEEPVGVAVVNDPRALHVREAWLADVLVVADAAPVLDRNHLVDDSVVVAAAATAVAADPEGVMVITMLGRIGVARTAPRTIRGRQADGQSGGRRSRRNGSPIRGRVRSRICQPQPQLDRVSSRRDMVERVNHVDFGLARSDD